MTGRRWSAIAAVAALAACGWWQTRGTDAPAARGAGLAAREARVYDLTWDGTSVADGAELPGGVDAYTGEVHLRARLVVRGLGRDGDTRLVGYRLADVASARYQVLGRDLLAGLDVTAGELVAALGPDGGLRALRPDPAAAPAAELLLRAIVQQSVVTLGGGDRWDALEPGPTGLARMAYRRAGDGLVRTRTGYATLAALPAACPACREQLDGRAQIGLDPGGRLRELDDREHLVVTDARGPRVVVDNHFVLRASTRVVAARARPRLDGRTTIAASGAGVAPGSDDAERARGWSLARIATTVARFLATGATPAEPLWMHGVAGFLRLHPAACQELLRMFAAPDLPAAGRDLIASMLIAAGTPAAQAALRDGIDGLARDRGDLDAARVLARIGLLAQPTADTVAWLASHRAPGGERAATASAATLALGAAIGRLDDPALASRHAQALGAELASAREPAQRVELLAALGNAGRAADAAAIGAHAHDPDRAVRQQVTRALRKLDDHAAVAPLTALASDADGSVRAAALEMLGRRGLDPATADQAARGALAAGARAHELGALVRLLTPHAADPQVAATLRELLDVVEAPAVRAQIHHALAS